MNKKLLTLCVSALLAGGMVTPAFASVNNAENPYDVTSVIMQPEELNSNFFYEIKVNSTTSLTNVSYANRALKATFDTYGITASSSEISGYSLWRFVKHTNENGVFDGYHIVNAYGIPLAITKTSTGWEFDKDGSVKLFQFVGTGNNQLIAKTSDGDIFLYWDSELKLGTQADATNHNLAVAIYLPESRANTASELESVYGDYFSLQIGKYNSKNEFEEYTLKGNVFTGELRPASNADLDVNGVTIATLQNDETFLMNEAGEFLVLLNEVWDDANTNLNNADLKGYKFSTMSAKTLGETLKADASKAADKKTIKSYVFRVAGINGHIKDVDAPLEVAVKMEMDDTSYDANTWAELQVAGVDGNYYLTTARAASTDAYNPLDDKLDLNVADYTSTTYVRFGKNNYVSATAFWGAAWNITKVVGDKTFNPQSGNLVDRREVGYAVPEGQWILREENKKQAWVNRETGYVLTDVQFDFSKLRATDTENVYSLDNVNYRIEKAVDLANTDRFDYFGLDAKQTSVGVEQTYRVQFTNALTGEPTYISMDGVGELHLTADPVEALRFHVDTMKTTDDAVVVNGIGRNANVDVFDIYNTYMGWDAKNEKWVEKTDTVSFHRYNLSYNGKYLNFNANNNKYELVDPVYYTADAGTSYAAKYLDHNYIDAYVIKEKGGDIVNILNTVQADFDDIITDKGGKYNSSSAIDILNWGDGTNVTVNAPALLACDSTQMMYFDFNFAEARQQANIYNWVANAQLNLDYQDYNIYRNIAPVAPDTVAIYRTEYSDEFLFEKGDFLGMTYDRDGYNAALFADTAYVRNNTEKPLFMLAVRPEITPAKTYCPIHGENAGCADEHLKTIPGYVDADYLTSLADSAAAYAKLLDNPYLANGQYTKLAFVGARHNVDTVTVASTGKKFTITEGLVNPMLFAFRIVNQETQDFVIETADLANNKAEFDAKKNPYVVSYVRWNNGVPVLTTNMADAEVFNIKTDLKDANPTANEEIATSSVVVAGTNGAVVVKGAEGKNVIVSTILGKVVANEVVSSDNATIAAPQGVVVVSVDGESFKVVVK